MSNYDRKRVFYPYGKRKSAATLLILSQEMTYPLMKNRIESFTFSLLLVRVWLSNQFPLQMLLY